MPWMARRAYRLEMTATFFFALALGVIENGVASVFAKQTYSGVAPETLLNYCVALLGAMDALANVLSFVWSWMSQGRAKIAFINVMQGAVLLSIGSIALMPRTTPGLLLTVLAVLVARTCWSGIITVRPTVWRANYPREVRARIVGRIARVQVLVIAITGAVLGRLLDGSLGSYRWAVVLAAALGVIAVLATRRQRVRRQRRLLREESAGGAVLPPWMGPVVVWRVLRRDRGYARYMLWMFVLGFGNIMVGPALAIALRDQFGLSYFGSILIATTIPYVVQSAAIPAWARLLDRAHVVKFRSIHAWFFVGACVLLVLGAWTNRVEWMYAAAVVQGVAYAGGTLAWNLGHVDFAPPQQTSLYMATHVTLNGVRGLLAPLASVTVYEMLRRVTSEASAWLFCVTLAVTTAGAVGFVAMRLSMGGAGAPARLER